MSMTVTNNSDITKIEFRNRDGSYVGTLTISNPSRKASKSKSVKKPKKKYKKLQYNFKRLSNQIMRAKTSINAKQLSTKTKFQIADLRMKLISGDYNYTEIHNALVHAEKIARVAKKRMKHLQEEESIEKTGRPGMTEPDEMKKDKDSDEEILDTSAMSQEEMEKLLQEIQEEMERIEKEMEETMKSTDLMEQFIEGSKHQMDPKDLEMLKKKHRADELRDIMKADMEYLKALFDKLSKEKEEGPSGIGDGSEDSSDSMSNLTGVMLELNGAEVPVEAAPVPVEAAGANVDVMA